MAETVLDGRFTLLGPLASGALTQVYRARDNADGAPVVVKRLHRHLAHDPGCRAMAAHEARLLAHFRHPHIPRGVASGDDPGGWCAAVELVAGDGLDAVMARGRVAPGAALAVVGDVLEALAHAHEAVDEAAALGVVHRDVCPANVLVTPEGRAVLVDFGIATSRWRVDPDRGVMKGTRGYMAPEVVTGSREADARADLFAVGVILAELLSGRRVYEAPAPAVFDAIVEGPVPSPRAADPSVPPALDAVARRALAKSPDDRYPSARAMIAALDDACATAGVPRDL